VIRRVGIFLGITALAASAASSLALAGGPPIPRYARPNDPMSIERVQLSERDMRAGDSVTGTVITTVNVAAVTAQAGTYRISLPKIAPGTFRTTVQVPRLWSWDWRGNVVITAIRTDGATIEASVPVEVRW
jgi:hypothetical protein